MVGSDFPGGGDEVGDLHERELTETLHFTGNLDRDGVLDSGSSRKDRDVEQRNAVFVGLRLTRLEIEDGFSRSGCGNFTAVVSIGKRMVAPSWGATFVPHLDTFGNHRNRTNILKFLSWRQSFRF